MTQDIPPQADPSTVRHYSADGTLTVTRDDETDEHVIKSKGRERGDKWTRRVPATRTTVEVGEKIWSIPDNWTRCYRLKTEYNQDKGIYRIAESGDAVLLSLGDKNNRIVDAFHLVKQVGSVTWSARVDVDQDALSDAVSYVDDYSEEFDAAVRDVLQFIRDNPRRAVKDAEEWAEMTASECVVDHGRIPNSEFDPFYETFRSKNEIVSHPDHQPSSKVMADVHELLSDFGVVPPSPLVSVTVREDC